MRVWLLVVSMLIETYQRRSLAPVLSHSYK
jgi:hypothetical protein